MSEVLALFQTSQSLLLLCMGVSAMIGLLHLWMAGGRWDANLWIAAWAGLACVLLASRGVQLTTGDPAAALQAGRVTLAVGPFLVWAIVGFTGNLHARDGSGVPTLRLFGAVSVLWALAIMTTPWFVEPTVSTRTDFFGATHYSVHTRWPTLLLAVYIGGVFAWGIRRLRRSGRLEPVERRVLLVGFGLYVLMGVAALLTGLEVIPIPAMAEYGPFVVGISLSYLLVHRRRVLERQLAERVSVQTSQLAASEERYRDLVEHAPLGVFACDLDGAVTTMNRMAETFAQFSPDGSIEDFFESTEPAGLPEAARDALEDGSVVCRDTRCTLSDGSAVDLRITATPLHDDQGEARGALLLAEDVTERNHLERQLMQAQKMESVGQLASGIAHEINNPMAYVRANLATISEGTSILCKELDRSTFSPEARDRLAELETLVDESREGVERTIAIVRDMREFAYGGAEERQTTDLAELLAACARFAAVFGKAEVEIHESYEPDLAVHGASGPLRQVFYNLLVNALQAVGDRGRVHVEADRWGGTIRVRIHDDGPGVSDDARSRLFDPFFTTKSVGEGTGLGLYISYQIVSSHGGDIHVEKGPLGGALFCVELPAASG